MRLDEIRAKVNSIITAGLLDGEPYDDVIEYIEFLEAENKQLNERVFELEDCVIDMLGQFAYSGNNKKYGGEILYTGGLSALENAFSVMDIPDPVKKDDFYGKGWNGTEDTKCDQ